MHNFLLTNLNKMHLDQLEHLCSSLDSTQSAAVGQHVAVHKEDFLGVPPLSLKKESIAARAFSPEMKVVSLG